MTKSTSLRKHKNVLGPFLKLKRDELGYSLMDLAILTGLSRGYLSDMENGRRGYSLPGHTVSILANALNIPEALITAKMVTNTNDDAQKYGEYYRVLRSNVRAAQIARMIARIRSTCVLAKNPLLAEKERVKLLQDIEKTVENIDRTLAYRGKPPVSVQPGADTGDDDKFLEVGRSGKG